MYALFIQRAKTLCNEKVGDRQAPFRCRKYMAEQAALQIL